MGYKIIKRPKGGVRECNFEEFISVGMQGIRFSTGLKERLRLDGKNYVLLMTNDDGFLCFDIKDFAFPEAIPVRLNKGKQGRSFAIIRFTNICVKAGIKRGRYKITGQDGLVYITNAKVTKEL